MLKYECDICHQVVNPADAYGPGVMRQAQQMLAWLEGKAKAWEMMDDQAVIMGVHVVPYTAIDSDTESAVCGACTGRILKAMIKEIWPDDEDDSGDNRADSDVSEVRVEPEVSEPSANDNSIITPEEYSSRCRSCTFPIFSPPGRNCTNPDVHSIG